MMMSKVSVSALRALLLSGTVLLGLAGCAMVPEAEPLDRQIQQAALDRAAMFAAQEPVTAPLTLEQAIARAVRYNLQHRLTLMERALEDRVADAGSLDMLPKLAARAGAKTRSNESSSVSSGSVVPSTSSDETTRTADLQLSWSVLDFGLNYYGAKAQANKILATEERRRRVVLSLVEQVRAAWWDAVTAQRLGVPVQTMLKEANEALEQSRQTEEQRLLPPLESLRYQKGLLEAVQQLEALASDLALAKAQLAALMNLAPGTEFTVAVPDDANLTRPAMTLSLDKLEAVAMVERPEIREELYLARNIALDTRMSILRLLPGATLFGGLNYDSNSHLVNNSWADAGVQVSWNLLNVLTLPRTLEVTEAREAVADTRRQALRMAVLAQVNVAWHRFNRADGLYQRFAELLDVESRIYAQTQSATASNAQSRLERIRAGAGAVLATRARDRAYAELRNAQGAIYQAAGLDPLPETLPDGDVDTLARAVSAAMAALDAGEVEIPNIDAAPDLSQAATPPEAVPVAATTTPDAANIPEPAASVPTASVHTASVHTASVSTAAPVEGTAPRAAPFVELAMVRTLDDGTPVLAPIEATTATPQTTPAPPTTQTNAPLDQPFAKLLALFQPKAQ
jgi:outer membrane protein TolC